MSSDLKDARWGLAMARADQNDFDWYAMSYADKEFFLARARVELDANPEDIAYWAAEFRREDEDYDPKWDDVHHGEMIW